MRAAGWITGGRSGATLHRATGGRLGILPLGARRYMHSVAGRACHLRAVAGMRPACDRAPTAGNRRPAVLSVMEGNCCEG